MDSLGSYGFVQEIGERDWTQMEPICLKFEVRARVYVLSHFSAQRTIKSKTSWALFRRLLLQQLYYGPWSYEKPDLESLSFSVARHIDSSSRGL